RALPARRRRSNVRPDYPEAAAVAGAVHEPFVDRSFEFPIPAMNRILHTICAVSIAAGLAIVVSARPQQPAPPAPASPAPPATPQQPGELATVISSEG